MIYFSTFFSKHRPESKNNWSNHFTHYAFVKTRLLIICEEPTSKHPVLEINIDKYCSYLQMLKCSIFRTSLLNIEQGSFLSQMSPSQKVCKYTLPLHTLSKLYDVPVSFAPPPYFDAVYCFICCRRRVALARYRMICLVL